MKTGYYLELEISPEKLLIKLRKSQKLYYKIIPKYLKIPKERYTSPEERQEIIDELRLI